MTKITHYNAEQVIGGEEFYAAVRDMEPILSALDRRVAVAACLGSALTIQEPELTLKEVYDGIRGASEWICLYLSTTDAAREARGGEPEVLN